MANLRDVRVIRPIHRLFGSELSPAVPRMADTTCAITATVESRLTMMKTMLFRPVHADAPEKVVPAAQTVVPVPLFWPVKEQA